MPVLLVMAVSLLGASMSVGIVILLGSVGKAMAVVAKQRERAAEN